MEVLPRLATQFARVGEPERAEALFDRTLELTTQIEEPAVRVRGINQYVTNVGRLEDRQQAKLLLERGTNEAFNILGSTHQLEVLPRLAIEFARVGEPERAEALFDRTLELTLQMEDKGQAYAILRQATDEALDNLEPAQQLEILPFLAIQLARSGDMEQWRSFFNKASILLPQVSPLERIRFFTTSAKAIVNDDFQKSIELLDKAYQVARESPPSQKKWKLIIDVISNMPRMEAFAMARIEGYSRPEAPLIRNKEYKLLVGVQKEAPSGLVVRPEQLPKVDAVSLEVRIRVEGIEVLPQWIQKATFLQGQDIEPLEFKLIPQEVGYKQIEIEFYYQRHWLTSLKLDVDIV